VRERLRDARAAGAVSRLIRHGAGPTLVRAALARVDEVARTRLGLRRSRAGGTGDSRGEAAGERDDDAGPLHGSSYAFDRRRVRAAASVVPAVAAMTVQANTSPQRWYGERMRDMRTVERRT